MSPPDAMPATETVFSEPWQAQAFALTLELSRRGYFSWSQWSQALAEELHSAQQRGQPDDGSRYYHHWVAALEQLVQSRRLLDQATLQQRKLAWIRAYEHTPHGHPVELTPHTSHHQP